NWNPVQERRAIFHGGVDQKSAGIDVAAELGDGRRRRSLNPLPIGVSDCDGFRAKRQRISRFDPALLPATSAIAPRNAPLDKYQARHRNSRESVFLALSPGSGERAAEGRVRRS